MVTREMLEKLDHKMQVMFAVFCAKQVLHLVKEEYKEVCLKTIEAAEGFVEGKVSKEECYAAAAYAAAANAAAYAAYAANAANAAAYAAANAAAYAAYAANAANAALARKDVEQEQIRYYNELLNFDKIVEDILGV